MLYVKFAKNRLHGFRGDVIWECWPRRTDGKRMPAYTIISHTSLPLRELKMNKTWTASCLIYLSSPTLLLLYSSYHIPPTPSFLHLPSLLLRLLVLIHTPLHSSSSSPLQSSSSFIPLHLPLSLLLLLSSSFTPPPSPFFFFLQFSKLLVLRRLMNTIFPVTLRRSTLHDKRRSNQLFLSQPMLQGVPKIVHVFIHCWYFSTFWQT